jgi:hypothetical protein
VVEGYSAGPSLKYLEPNPASLTIAFITISTVAQPRLRSLYELSKSRDSDKSQCRHLRQGGVSGGNTGRGIGFCTPGPGLCVLVAVEHGVVKLMPQKQVAAPTIHLGYCALVPARRDAPSTRDATRIMTMHTYCMRRGSSSRLRRAGSAVSTRATDRVHSTYPCVRCTRQVTRTPGAALAWTWNGTAATDTGHTRRPVKPHR